MARKFKTQLGGQIGEHLVVAELGRRGIVATPFAGNVPDIDILAYKDGNSVPIQVKTNRKGDLSVDARRYLDIEFEGDIQRVVGKSNSINRDLLFVVVQIGEKLGLDKFFIFKQGTLQDLIYENHTNFLSKHGGIRPRNPQSTHCAYNEKSLEKSEDKWDLISDSLR